MKEIALMSSDGTVQEVVQCTPEQLALIALLKLSEVDKVGIIN